jgi:hypothetical protein
VPPILSIQIQKLTKRYASFEAVKNVSFTLTKPQGGRAGLRPSSRAEDARDLRLLQGRSAAADHTATREVDHDRALR